MPPIVPYLAVFRGPGKPLPVIRPVGFVVKQDPDGPWIAVKTEHLMRGRKDTRLCPCRSDRKWTMHEACTRLVSPNFP